MAIGSSVSVSDVKSEMSVGNNSVSSLCTHSNINMYSFCSPCSYSINGTTKIVSKSNDTAPYQLGDFRRYNHSAQTPTLNAVNAIRSEDGLSTEAAVFNVVTYETNILAIDNTSDSIIVEAYSDNARTVPYPSGGGDNIFTFPISFSTTHPNGFSLPVSGHKKNEGQILFTQQQVSIPLTSTSFASTPSNLYFNVGFGTLDTIKFKLPTANQLNMSVTKYYLPTMSFQGNLVENNSGYSFDEGLPTVWKIVPATSTITKNATQSISFVVTALVSGVERRLGGTCDIKVWNGSSYSTLKTNVVFTDRSPAGDIYTSNPTTETVVLPFTPGYNTNVVLIFDCTVNTVFF